MPAPQFPAHANSMPNDAPLLRIGPVLLAFIVGLQATFWAWGKWSQTTPSKAQWDSLTLLGQNWYRPDDDLPIYIAGLLLCLVLAAILDAVWSRRLGSAQSEDRLQSIRLILLLHFPVAGGLAFLRLFYFPSKTLSLLSATLGLLFCVVALGAASRSRISDFGGMLLPKLFWRGAEAAIVIALVIFIVYVPYPEKLVGLSYLIDHFHHIDFYAMAPALAFRHGVALGTDFYSQYGVGWPMILAFLSKIGPPLSYKLLFSMSAIWACLYYMACYAFLRQLCRSAAWAMAGLLFVLLLQLVSGTDYGFPKMLWPSSTVMRYPMDVFLFSALLMHARGGTGRAWLGLPTGVFTALAVLLGTDTGLYLVVCLVVYLLAVQRLRPAGAAPPQLGTFATSVLLGFGVVLLGGLAIASRGTLLTTQFWFGWTESLRIYSDGFGHLPIESALRRDWTADFLLVLMLTCYLLAVARMLQQFWRRRLTPEPLIVGLIATYGLATLLLFVGRSHPYNLHHPSIPFCIVLLSFTVEIWNAARLRVSRARSTGDQAMERAALRMVPLTCAYIALVAICVHPTFQKYPNVFRWYVEDRLSARQTPDSNYLFASRRDGPLADNLREEIAKFRAVTTVMRDLSDGGRKSIAMIDGFDTSYLVEADLRPYFRYSPVIANIAFKQQVTSLNQQLIDHPPDYVLFPVNSSMAINGIRVDDVYSSFLIVIQRLFTLDGQVADMAIYRRRP